MEVIENGNLIGTINGMVFGGAGLVAGETGLSLYTNGINQYVDFGYQGDTCLGSISLCAHGWATAFWMKLADDPSGTILDFAVYGYESVRIYMARAHFKIRFIDSNKAWGVSVQRPSSEDWIHLVATWELCYGAKLYIDGQLGVQTKYTSNAFIPSPDIQRFVMGADTKYGHKFKMKLDELRVWDAVMSDEEVLALYNIDAGRNWGTYNESSGTVYNVWMCYCPHECDLFGIIKKWKKNSYDADSNNNDYSIDLIYLEKFYLYSNILILACLGLC